MQQIVAESIEKRKKNIALFLKLSLIEWA